MNRVKKIRKQKKMTTQQLANSVGVTERYIAFIEQGKRTPSLTIAGKIAKTLNSSVDRIFL